VTAWRKFGSVRSVERSLASTVVPELRDPSHADRAYAAEGK
jgi:hypothetical protein